MLLEEPVTGKKKPKKLSAVTEKTHSYITEINKYRTTIGLTKLKHSHMLSGQSKIWATGQMRGVNPPERAAVFAVASGSESIENGVINMLKQRSVSGPGGVCMDGTDCHAWRVLMDRAALQVGCALSRPSQGGSIVICTTDHDITGIDGAVY